MNADKSRPPSILTTNSNAPILMSPIALSHTAKNNINANGLSQAPKKQTNWMREKWIANLKKMQEKKLSQKQASEYKTASRTMNTGQNCPNTNNKKGHRGKGTKQVPRRGSKGNLSTSPLCVLSAVEESEKTNQWVKQLVRKRTSHIELDPTAQRPRTPRRKLNSGASYEEFDCQSVSSNNSYSSAHSAQQLGDTGMGSIWPIPNNTNAKNVGKAQLDVEFDAKSLDSFFNLQSPKTPRLVRTESFEQEGLSQFLEQTKLSTTPPSEPWLNSNSVRADPPKVETGALEQELDSFYLENLQSLDTELGFNFDDFSSPRFGNLVSPRFANLTSPKFSSLLSPKFNRLTST